MKLPPIESKIIRALVRSDGELQTYTLYRRYLIPIGALAEAIVNLEKKELVASEQRVISLTEKAEKLALQGAFSAYTAGERPWRKCPDKFRQLQIDWREPYVPKRSELATDLLEMISCDESD